MAVKVETGGPMAKALEGIITPKLLEVGWSTDPQDNTLTEYIVLMLANGKSQDEVARELSGDLLGLSPDDTSAIEFAQWLFQQVDLMGNEQHHSAPSHIPTGPAADAEMSDADGSNRSIPTGPKAMRAGNPSNRMFSQISRNMDRGGDSLHKIQGNNGRIGRNNAANTRGTRGNNMQRNLENVARRQMQGFNQMPGQPGFGFQMPPEANAQAMMMKMLEDQAAMFQQLAQQGILPQQGSFKSNGNGNGNGKPLGDRIRGRGNRGNQRGGRNNQGRRDHHNHQNQDEDTAMGEVSTNGDGDDDANKDPYSVLCRFNLYCTKPDCTFAHQSPAAPENVTVDLESDCQFGAACKNFKCVSRHPSPAKKLEHQQQQECKFGPYCTNPGCPFKHSTQKPCRNGADCTTPDCPFFHTTTECKFNPCTNAHCAYKHKEGQKAASANVWKSGAEHVSDRKFVTDDDAPEELIIAESSSSGGGAQGAGEGAAQSAQEVNVLSG